MLNTHAVANLIRTRKEPQIISIQETQLPMKNTRDGRTRCEGTIWLSATTTYIIRSTIIVGEGMEAYEYVVKDKNNETIKGLIWADSEQEVGTRLKRDGYKIYKITLQVDKKKHKWNHAMVVDVTYQLGLLIESGVPLRRALQLLCQGKKRPLYTALYESIERGQTLSQALRSEGCPAIALALLESGEAAGTLGESLHIYITSL